MIYIDFWGAPCTGKTTAAHTLFAEMKRKGLKVAFCREVFSEWVVNNNRLLDNPVACFAAQFLENKRYSWKDFDFIIRECSVGSCSCYTFVKPLVELINVLEISEVHKVAVYMPWNYDVESNERGPQPISSVEGTMNHLYPESHIWKKPFIASEVLQWAIAINTRLS